MAKIKPATEGLIVRDPFTLQPLPDAGVELELTPFWARRIRAGDVVVIEDTPAPAASPKKTTAVKE